MSDPKPTDAALELAQQQAVAIPVPLHGKIDDLDSAYRYAYALARADIIPEKLRNKPSNVLVIILYGQLLGLDPVVAMNTIGVSNNGRPVIEGKVLLAKVREAGHRPKIEHGDNECSVTIVRGDTGEDHTEKFTLEMAAAAGLVQMKNGKPEARSQSGKKLPWENYTGRMLMWRALGWCVDVICPEVKMGFAIEGDDDTVERDDRPPLGKVAGRRAAKPDDAPPLNPPDTADNGEVVDATIVDDDVAQQVADIEARHTQNTQTVATSGAPTDPDEQMWAEVVEAEKAAETGPDTP